MSVQSKANDADVRAIDQRARDLVAAARDLGVLLTIEAVPLKPLRMGNVEMVVQTRAAREPS